MMVRIGNLGVQGTGMESRAQEIVWPLLIIAFLIWLEGQNRRSGGFLGGF